MNFLEPAMKDKDLTSPYSSPWQFLWQNIKPYRWWYALMFQAPVLTALYIFANNYSLKLLIDNFSTGSTIEYHH
jgi:ATP-binding cassette, subfamily B, bacterial